ncbi:MAG: hypothetical protein DCC50_09855, partial [Acidobacteria bacterium]
SVPSQGAALLVMTVVAIAAVGAVGLVLMKVLGRVLTRMSALEPPVEPDEADTDTAADAGSGPAAVPGRSSGCPRPQRLPGKQVQVSVGSPRTPEECRRHPRSG